MIISALIAFSSMVALDFAWARYNIACSNKRAAIAGLYASAILTLGAFVVLTYVEDHWMLIPAALGAFVGTFIAVRTA